MNSERLRELIGAYGAWPDRWPPEERTAALAALADRPEADAELRAAQALDALLDAWRPAPPSEGLVETTFTRAMAQRGPPAPRAAGRAAGPRLPRRAVAWMSSAGLAAACAAGVMAGVGLGDACVSRAGDMEAVGGLLDGVTAFGAQVDLEKGG